MYKPLREDNQQGGVNTTVATVTNLEKGKTIFDFYSENSTKGIIYDISKQKNGVDRFSIGG